MSAKIYPSHGLVMVKRESITGTSQNFLLNINFFTPDFTVSPNPYLKDWMTIQRILTYLH